MQISPKIAFIKNLFFSLSCLQSQSGIGTVSEYKPFSFGHMTARVPDGVTITHVTKRFGNICALDDLCLDVERGKVFGFLGSNGAGKTTTLRILLGLLSPSSGTVSVLGLDPARSAFTIRQRCGVLLEHSGVYGRLTSLENLRFVGAAYGMKSGDVAVRSEELLTEFELWSRRNELVSIWSRGMRQKLSLACALIHRPELVFLDEPTAGLDPVATASIRNTIVGIVANMGATVFLTTHNLAEAERLCDQVAILRKGKLLLNGPPSLLGKRKSRQLRISGSGFDESLVARVRNLALGDAAIVDGDLLIGLADSSDPSEIVAAIVSAGGRITSVIEPNITLEQVYLDVMENERAN